MVFDNVEQPAQDNHSMSTESQVTDDPALKDSQSGRSTAASSFSSEEEARFVKKETRHVFMLRVVVLLLLFAASAAMSLVVYFITSAGEDDAFESQYNAAADKVAGTYLEGGSNGPANLYLIPFSTFGRSFLFRFVTLRTHIYTESFHEIVTHKMEAVGSLVVAMIAHGLDHHTGWPFVTLTSFQERAYTVKDISGVLYLGMNPIVSRQERLAWENYTNHHPDAEWYQEGRSYQKSLGADDLDNRPQVRTDDPELDLTTGVANYIYDFDRDHSGKGVISPEAEWYLPIWQVSFDIGWKTDLT